MSVDAPIYREAAAHPLLQQYVACTWSDTGGPAGGFVLPDGCMDIVCRGEEVFVAGTDTGPVPAAGGGPVVGIRFRPGCGPAFLGAPASELRDQRVPLAELWGTASRSLCTVTALEDALLRRLPPPGAVDPVVEAAVATLAARSSPVAALARRFDLEERQLHRRFVATVGYGPKTLDRVLRFRRATRLGWDGVPLARVAAEAGYADQAHLSREVRRLAGTTPSDLFKTAGAAPS